MVKVKIKEVMDKRSYKNFNMVIELDISGEFIYNGIHEIYRLPYFTGDGPTFSALYSIAVGIERLQKILIVLWELDDNTDNEEFSKGLITHSHTGLRDRIKKIVGEEGTEISFSNRENDLFSLLEHFYKSLRYERFIVGGGVNEEYRLIKEFIDKYAKCERNQMYIEQDGYIKATKNVKELFGRTIGSITKKYYSLVKEGSNRNGLFTYELRPGSNAEKMFIGEHRKNSLMDEQFVESIAIKELLIYYRNTCDKNAFLGYIEEISPLDFDKACLVDYFSSIVNGIIPQELIDFVECEYEENGFGRERIEIVDLFADNTVFFEYSYIDKAWKLFQTIDNMVTEEQADALMEFANYIDDDEIETILIDANHLINAYISNKIKLEEYNKELEIIRDQYKKYVLPEYD